MSDESTTDKAASQGTRVGRIFVPYKDLKTVIGVRYTRVHLNRLIAAGKFPAPRSLSDNRRAWTLSSLLEWAESRPVAKSAKPSVSSGGEQEADQLARRKERVRL